jgi:hypothetical protein
VPMIKRQEGVRDMMLTCGGGLWIVEDTRRWWMKWIKRTMTHSIVRVSVSSFQISNEVSQGFFFKRQVIILVDNIEWSRSSWGLSVSH